MKKSCLEILQAFEVLQEVIFVKSIPLMNTFWLEKFILGQKGPILNCPDFLN